MTAAANNAAKQTVLSAVQTTNNLHLGNYLGAIKNWVNYQDTHDCIFFAVDMHAITMRQNPKQLHENTYQAIATYLACGIDPKKSIIFVQSHVPAHAELSWVLTCHSTMGELSRMTQFKDKSAKNQSSSKGEDSIPTGIFTYPLLMAADILLYGTNLVPVGEDQKQHLELARDLAIRMNSSYPSDGFDIQKVPHGTKDPHALFVVPEPLIGKVGARIMSLQNPEAKMSKSDPTPGGAVFLTDSDGDIERKFKRAVTDSDTEVKAESQSDGVKNLIQIQATVTGETYDAVLNKYVGRGYGYLKVDTGKAVASAIAPIREKTAEYLRDRSHLDQVLKAGREAATARAEKTLNEVYKRVGFVRQ
ncbi:MAG: tryptophan--tRNA ligase [Bdellovibrionales bacterium]|nr:tryptophan--tRNA ligase [Bdellovibrionales bacterium]